MTPDEIRVKVAEAMGWTRREGYVGDYQWNNPAGCGAWLPRWDADLNACAEFEAGLTDEDSRWKYIEELICITGAESMEVHAEVFVVSTATPLQRCEAFLRVKGIYNQETK